MHWFWRATITIVCVGLYLLIALTVPTRFGRNDPLIAFFAVLLSILILLILPDRMIDNIAGHVVSGFRRPMGVLHRVFMAIMLPCIIVAVWVEARPQYELRMWKHPSDGETRCRKCGYILRSISEPRCPECGERI